MHSTSSHPASPRTPVRRLKSVSETCARVSSQTGRQGPTGAAGGDQPGARPSSVVRNQRSCWFSTMGARHLGRGRFAFRSRSSAWKRMTSSFASRSRPSIARSWATNMLLLLSSGSPFSQTSATVASPSNPSTSCSFGRCWGGANLTRYHQSSESKRRGGASRLHSCAAPRHAAAVEGARAAIHATGACLSASGSAYAPGGAEQSSQPVVSGWRR